MQLKLDTAPARDQDQEQEQEHRGHGDNLAAKLGIVKLGKVAGKVGGRWLSDSWFVECSGYTSHPHLHLTDEFKIPMIHWKLSETKSAMENIDRGLNKDFHIDLDYIYTNIKYYLL